MKRTAGEVADFLGVEVSGDSAAVIEGIASLEDAGAGDLSYAESRYLDRVSASSAACVLVPDGDFGSRTTIAVANPKAAFARAAYWLFPERRPEPGVHRTAVVGQNVVLGDDVSIGPWCVIEDGVEVGESTAVQAGCYIAEGCRIGVACRLHANVVLYAGSRLGDRVVVHAGAVIGSDGFGYVRDGDGYVKFPQMGRLVLEDDVEIGAGTCIDRGSLGSTVIGKGTKLDNLCHVAHNVRVGGATVIAAQTGISGSCTVGADAVLAGQVGVADHVRIDDGAVVGAQCGIPSGKRIRAGEVFWGTPARPLKDIKIQQAHISRLPKMAKELARLRQEVEQLLGEPTE